jgi:hypothetical protein
MTTDVAAHAEFHAMMLGKPEAFEAERLNMAGKIDRLLKRLTWCFT